MSNNPKYIFLLLILFSGICNKSFAQQNKESESQSELCVKKDNIIIDGYYGAPYVMGSYVKSVFENSSNSSSIEAVKNLNHFGGKFEYMLSESIGVGLEYTYAAVNINYKVDKTILNSNGQALNQTYHYKASLYKQRILGRVNFHFETTDKIDPYGTIGFGYKTSRLKSNNPDDQIEVAAFNASFSNFFPVSYRLGIGLRYFFTPEFGLNIEGGFGGPTVQGGLTLKF